MEFGTDSGIQATDISHEEENYLRFANLLMRIAPPAVRKTFDKEFHPDKLKEVLDRNRVYIFENMRGRKIINQAQWNLLFSKSENVTSNDFDLTLMICLLRHLAEIKVGDKLPVLHDKSAEADLTRIKYYRNKVMHSDDGTLSDHSFNSWWAEISQAIIRIGGSSFEEHCNSLKIRRLDSYDREITIEIKNLANMIDTFQKGKRQLNEIKIAKWKKETVAETRAIRRLAEMITIDNIVVAIGPSGCGKSTAIHYIALWLARIHHYDIVIVYDLDDMIQSYNPDSKQVFVIDDVVGAVTLNEDRALKWLDKAEDINIIIESSQVKLLASSKTHIFKHSTVESIAHLSNYTLDFVSSDYCLTYNDRIKIANEYLTNNEIRSLKVHNVILSFDFFPVLCRYYSDRKSSNIVEFFSNPVKAVTNDLIKLKNQPLTFATLFMFVIYNNCIVDSVFLDESKIMKIIEDIYNNFHIKSRLSIQIVKNEMDKLMNSYLKKENSAYTIIHDKIFDILVLYCGEHQFEFMLKVAHTDLIRDRFAVKSLLTENTIPENIVKIPTAKENYYFDRLKKDIQQGFIHNVFSNRNLKDKSFRFKFITEIAKDIVDSLPEKTVFTLLMSMIDREFCDIVIVLLTKVSNLDRMYWDGETPLFKAACKGYTEVVLLLLKNQADPNFCSCFNGLSHIEKMYPGIIVTNISNNHDSSIHDWRDLHVSCPAYREIPRLESRLCQTADPLLEREDTNYPVTEKSHLKNLSVTSESRFEQNKPYRISPLHIAASKGNTNIVQLLLSYNGEPDCVAKSNHIASPLYIASNQGYTDIVHLITNSMFNSDVTAPNMQTPKQMIYKQSILKSSLYVAVQKGHLDIVKVLLKHKLNHNQCLDHFSKSRQHSMFDMNFYLDMVVIARVNGHDELVKLILENSCDSNFPNETDVSPLFKAMCDGKTEIVKYLLKPHFDFKTSYKNIEAPLIAAASVGHTEIVELLLDHNSDPNFCNNVGISPLIAASSAGHTEIVKLLLDHNSDPNVFDKNKETPLFRAAYGGHTEIVKLLLSHHSDVTLGKKNGETPLFVASKLNHTEVVNLLLDHL